MLDLLLVKQPGFQEMIDKVALAVRIAGAKDISRRLADEAGVPIDTARAVVRGLKAMTQAKPARRAA